MIQVGMEPIKQSSPQNRGACCYLEIKEDIQGECGYQYVPLVQCFHEQFI